MEKSEMECKYQKLATEYSKVRSHATVLKKAVLEEQAKILNLKEIVKEQEQKIRKHDQEMESLTFRNEQLTKRIFVLQQELQVNSHVKKGKGKPPDGVGQINYGVIDEELQKKIIENAQLASTMADKELELSNYQEKVEWLEERLVKAQAESEEKLNAYKEKVEKSSSLEMKAQSGIQPVVNNYQIKECMRCRNKDQKNDVDWQLESDRWKSECEILRARPETDSQLTEYYESQIRELIESRNMCQSEAASLWADNDAVRTRLERLVLEKGALDSILDKSNEELHTTNENYRTQLDAMTEHLAAQNEKITRQCDEIQILKHKLSQRK